MYKKTCGESEKLIEPMAASTDQDHKDKEEDQAAAFSRRSWDRLNLNSHRPQWLQTTLSDLDKKTKAMLTIIQGDGDSFAKRAEMFYQKRPVLVETLEDLHKSYRSLAEKYDKLKSESLRAVRSKFLLSPNSFAQLAQQFQNCDKKTNVEETQIEEPDDENLSKEVNKRVNFVELGFLDREKMCYELNRKVSKLVEDNLREQAELIRRNDEKREVIKELGCEINRLMDENRALKMSCLENYNKAVDTKRNRVVVSRFRKLFCIRF